MVMIYSDTIKMKAKFEETIKNHSEKIQAKKLKGLMPINEAINILQVPEVYTHEMIEERFSKLFIMNDPTKGGSFYIQCKIMGAKLTLIETLTTGKEEEEILATIKVEEEMKKEEQEEEEEERKKQEDEKILNSKRKGKF